MKHHLFLQLQLTAGSTWLLWHKILVLNKKFFFSYCFLHKNGNIPLFYKVLNLAASSPNTCGEAVMLRLGETDIGGSG